MRLQAAQRLGEALGDHRRGVYVAPRRLIRAPSPRIATPRAGKVPGIVGKVVYWLAVLAISLALLVALVLFFESRDESTLDTGGGPSMALRY